MTLRPYRSVMLQSRSETIVQAITDSNQGGIIEAEETQPGILRMLFSTTGELFVPSEYLKHYERKGRNRYTTSKSGGTKQE